MTQERLREIRAWLERHYDDPDPPHAATWYLKECLEALGVDCAGLATRQGAVTPDADQRGPR